MQFTETFTVPPAFRIVDTPEPVVCVQIRERIVEIRRASQSFHLPGCDSFLLVGRGWRRIKRTHTGGKYRDATLLALLSHRIPALVGQPEQKAFPWLEHRAFDVPPLADHNMAASESRVELHAVARSIRRFSKGRCTLTKGESAAVRLLFASFCQPFVEVAFILRFMAVEPLLHRKPRPSSILSLIGAAIEAARQVADVDDGARASIITGLSGLYDESIGSAGRRLTRQRLRSRRYCDLPADKFFTKCYDVRNHLLHGRLDEFEQQQGDHLAIALGMFVPDLIAARHDA